MLGHAIHAHEFRRVLDLNVTVNSSLIEGLVLEIQGACVLLG